MDLCEGSCWVSGVFLSGGLACWWMCGFVGVEGVSFLERRVVRSEGFMGHLVSRVPRSL